jgi:hypothetical protein
VTRPVMVAEIRAAAQDLAAYRDAHADDFDDWDGDEWEGLTRIPWRSVPRYVEAWVDDVDDFLIGRGTTCEALGEACGYSNEWHAKRLALIGEVSPEAPGRASVSPASR